MGYAERSIATSFEDTLVHHLNTRDGWTAYKFGQGLLPEDCRDRLRRYEDGARRPSLIRWMPDILAIRDASNTRPFVALIDAKLAGSTPNHAVELSALETAEIYVDRFFTPTFFVFSDWSVLTPRDIRQRGTPGPEPREELGSGTPYLLVSKKHGRPFNEVFPTRPR